MLGCRGKLQNTSNVIHLVVEQIVDLTDQHKRVSGLDGEFPLQSGRGDEAKHGGSGPDSREAKKPVQKPRDIYIHDLHIDALKAKARNFR